MLLVDIDPQGNATTGSGIDKRAQTQNVYQVLLGERAIADVRLASPSGGYDLVPANRDTPARRGGAGRHARAGDAPQGRAHQAVSRMKKPIDMVASDYDFIILDCPPSLSLLTLNGLCAADSVLIPMQCVLRSRACPTWCRP